MSKQSTPPKIIDMHCHCAGIGAGDSGCFVSSQMRRSWKYKFYLRGFGLTDDDLVEYGDRSSIQRIAEQVGQSREVDGAVILAMDAAIDESGEIDAERTVIHIPNEFVARETAKHDQLYFGASVNPYRRDALERLEWCKQNGAKLVKWLPSIQGIDPSDRLLEAFYGRLIDLDLPLLSHAGHERSFTSAVNALSDPALLRFPLEVGVKVVVAHMGSVGKNEGQDNMERTLSLMNEYPNLWGDVSALTQINRKRFFRRTLEAREIHDRLLYGTDYPLINMPVVSAYYYPLRLSRTKMRSLAKIQNPWDTDVALKRALGLPDEVFHRSRKFLGIPAD